LTASVNPVATHHIPFFITVPGETDVLYNVTLFVVVGSIVAIGVIFLVIHSLPERMAHKSKKIQMDIVAVLCLLALFTHEHAFWFAALLLAYIDIPDFLSPFNRIASSVESLAGQDGGSERTDPSGTSPPDAVATDLRRPGDKGAVHA
jgi:hypothetical protein